MTRIYLDHNATSPLRAEAREAMVDLLGGAGGNASSVHGFGHSARMAIETAREEVARLIGARPEEVVLTAGGTESNNLAIYGAALRAAGTARRLVTSAIEHPSVLAVADDLEARGFEVVRVRPDRSGTIPVDAVLAAAIGGTALVSLMLANNETGSLQPVDEVGRELRRRGILFHCDAAQGPGKIEVDVERLQVDMLSIAAHKFGGPQGVGALYVRQGVVLHPYLRGGGQELNRRPGTENVAAIAGFGAAASAVRRSLHEEAAHMAGLRDLLEARVQALGAVVNSTLARRVPNTSNLAFAGVTGEALVIALDLEGIAVSAGSACSAGTIRRSHVLEAMGLGEAAGSSIRVSLGPGSTTSDVETIVEKLAEILGRIRSTAVLDVHGGRRG
jgi:cysteine desulfurase